MHECTNPSKVSRSSFTLQKEEKHRNIMAFSGPESSFLYIIYAYNYRPVYVFVYIYIYMIPHVFGDAVLGKSKRVKVYWSRWNWNFRGPWLPPLPSTQSRRWVHTQKWFVYNQVFWCIAAAFDLAKVCARHAILPSMLGMFWPKVLFCDHACKAQHKAHREFTFIARKAHSDSKLQLLVVRRDTHEKSSGWSYTKTLAVAV